MKKKQNKTSNTHKRKVQINLALNLLDFFSSPLFLPVLIGCLFSGNASTHFLTHRNNKKTSADIESPPFISVLRIQNFNGHHHLTSMVDVSSPVSLFTLSLAHCYATKQKEGNKNGNDNSPCWRKMSAPCCYGRRTLLRILACALAQGYCCVWLSGVFVLFCWCFSSFILNTLFLCQSFE